MLAQYLQTETKTHKSDFAVIYQFYLKEGRDRAYQESWHIVATYFKERRGALGSCLHQTATGLYLAYSRWPNKNTRDKSWPGKDAPSTELPDEVRRAITYMQESTDDARMTKENIVREQCLEVLSDFLLDRNFTINRQFTVKIKQCYLLEGREKEYQTAWETEYGSEDSRYAYGSCLHKTDKGLYVSYLRQPELALDEDATLPWEFEFYLGSQNAMGKMANCEDFERTTMLGLTSSMPLIIIDDLLTKGVNCIKESVTSEYKKLRF